MLFLSCLPISRADISGKWINICIFISTFLPDLTVVNVNAGNGFLHTTVLKEQSKIKNVAGMFILWLVAGILYKCKIYWMNFVWGPRLMLSDCWRFGRVSLRCPALSLSLCVLESIWVNLSCSVYLNISLVSSVCW